MLKLCEGQVRFLTAVHTRVILCQSRVFVWEIFPKVFSEGKKWGILLTSDRQNPFVPLEYRSSGLIGRAQ